MLASEVASPREPWSCAVLMLDGAVSRGADHLSSCSRGTDGGRSMVEWVR